jgi:hypothetical protein
MAPTLSKALRQSTNNASIQTALLRLALVTHIWRLPREFGSGGDDGHGDLDGETDADGDPGRRHCSRRNRMLMLALALATVLAVAPAATARPQSQAQRLKPRCASTVPWKTWLGRSQSHSLGPASLRPGVASNPTRRRGPAVPPIGSGTPSPARILPCSPASMPWRKRRSPAGSAVRVVPFRIFWTCRT